MSNDQTNWKRSELEEDLICYSQTYGPLCSNTYVLKGNPLIVIDAGLKIPETPDIVLFTHNHYDHTRALEYFKQKNSKIAMSQEDSTLINIQPDILITESKIIRNDRFVLECLSVPGHTPGSYAFYDRTRGILFSGDTWFGGSCIGKHTPEWRNTMMTSVNRLQSLSPLVKLCSGH